MKILKKSDASSRHGFVLIIVLAILAMLTLVGLAFVSVSRNAADISRSYLDEQRAKFLAESGVHYALAKLKEQLKDSNWFFTTTAGSRQWVYWGDVTDEGAVGAVPNPDISIEDAKNPSFAYETDTPAQNPTDSNTTPLLIKVQGKDVGFSGFMDASTYGTISDIYTLKVNDLAGFVYINDGIGHAANTANVKRLLNNLGKAVGVTGLGDTIIGNRPAGGYRSVNDLQKYFSATDFTKFKDFVTVYAWVDDKVVNPVPLSPAGTVTSEYLPELIASRPMAAAGSGTNPTATDSDGHIFRYGRGKNRYGNWVGRGASSGGSPTSLEFYDPAGNSANSMIYGWDELNPCYIERTSRAPVNINTAPYEVLVALLDGLQGFFVMETPNAIGGNNAYAWHWTKHYYEYNNFTSATFGVNSAYGLSGFTGIYRGEIGVIYKSAPIAGPTGVVNKSSPVGLAEKLADAIVKNRDKKQFEITREYEGPFTSWGQFNRFVDSLVKSPSNPSGILEDTTGRFDAIQTSFPNSPVKVTANQAMADTIKANFNPNLHFNEINPNSSLYTLVDKTDLIKWSTEFCFIPTGYWEITSLGRVLNPINPSAAVPEYNELAEKKVKVVVKLFSIARDDLQKNFYGGTMSATGVSDGSDGLPDIYAATGDRTSNNLPLETGPEPDAGLGPQENEYEGYVALATLGGDLPLEPAFASSKGVSAIHKPKGAIWETPAGTKNCSISGANVHAHFDFDFDLHYAQAATGNDNLRRSLTRLWNMGLASINDDAVPPYNFPDWSEEGVARDGNGVGSIGVTTYEETSSSIAYAGTWNNLSNAMASGGTAKYSSTSGNTATFTFTGNGVAWYSVMSANNRAAQVYIDGVLDAQINNKNYYGDNSVLCYVRTGLTNSSHTLVIVVQGTSGVYVDKFEVLTLNSSTGSSPRLGPYSPVDSPGITPFSSGLQNSRYRLCRSYVLPLSGTYTMCAPADLRTDGGYVERHNALLYWPGKSNALMPGMDDGSNMNFWVLQGGVSYWIKPGFFPEVAGKPRGFFTENRVHNRWSQPPRNPSPFSHWFLPSQSMADSGVYTYPTAFPPGVGLYVPITRYFTWGYSFIGRPYASVGGYYYYPGCIVVGGFYSGSINHGGHGEAGASSIGANKFSGHKWTHITLLWNMLGSVTNLSTLTTDMLVNGQRPSSGGVLDASGVYWPGYVVSDMPRYIWNVSDSGYQGGRQYVINPLRIGESSLSDSQLNFSPDSTIDEFYVWTRKGDAATPGTANYEGKEHFRKGRYYRSGNGVYTSRMIALETAGSTRALPSSSPVSAPDGSTPPPPVSSASTSAYKLLGVTWTLMSEDYRYSSNTANPMEYLMYDYKPQALASGAQPTAMTQRFEVQVSDGGVVPQWAVELSGAVLTNPGWNSVRDPSNTAANLSIVDPTKIQYKVKFVTAGLASDSILLSTPVLDDVVLIYGNSDNEILEYLIL